MLTTKELAKKLKVSEFIIRYHSHKLGLNKKRKMFIFSELEQDYIKSSIMSTKTVEVIVPVIQNRIVKETYYIYQSKLNYDI